MSGHRDSVVKEQMRRFAELDDRAGRAPSWAREARAASAPADGLRSSPPHRRRDLGAFPELADPHYAGGLPSIATLAVGQHTVTFTLDFFILRDPEIETRLTTLWGDYVRWWVAPENPARRLAPRILLPSFRDLITVTVLREHAPWWLTLFRVALANHLVVNVDEYRETRQRQRAMRHRGVGG